MKIKMVTREEILDSYDTFIDVLISEYVDNKEDALIAEWEKNFGYLLDYRYGTYDNDTEETTNESDLT